MERHRFEELVERAFESLPPQFRERVENVQIVVEDYPSADQLGGMRGGNRDGLLGLYEGIPLEKRGVWYGTSPTLPDRITLFQKNIEAMCRSEKDIEHRIHEVLIHEIGHHFGMSEEEIRAAGY